MKLAPKRKNKLIPIIIVALCLGAVSVVFLQSRFNSIPQLLSSHAPLKEKASFPAMDVTEFSADQQKVIEILKTEYALNPSGTKYSEGIEEAWCADFVSWVFNEAGVPLLNPNSGSWRIPGTYTLREYYESTGKLQLANSDYVPKVGDVMLYDNPSSFGQHVNIVIKNDDGVITTIGGNEPGGIRIVRHAEPDAAGFIGYGVF